MSSISSHARNLKSSTYDKLHNSDRASHNTDSQSTVTMAIQWPAPGHSINNLQITAIDHLPRADSIALLNKETYWIHTLKTMEPGGINTNEQTRFPISMHCTKTLTQ